MGRYLFADFWALLWLAPPLSTPDRAHAAIRLPLANPSIAFGGLSHDYLLYTKGGRRHAAEIALITLAKAIDRRATTH